MKQRITPWLLPAVILLFSCRDSTVEPPGLTRLEINTNITELAAGDSAVLGIIAYRYDKPTDLPPVRWSSSAPSVVSVRANGRVRALSAGTAWITASVSSISTSLHIRVIPVAPAHVT